MRVFCAAKHRSDANEGIDPPDSGSGIPLCSRRFICQREGGEIWYRDDRAESLPSSTITADGVLQADCGARVADGRKHWT